MKVISNTTPIISLASIGKLDILKELFNDIKAKKGFFLPTIPRLRWAKKTLPTLHGYMAKNGT